MILGLENAAGQVATKDGPPLAGAVFNGGIACAPTGEIYTTATVPVIPNYCNGFLVSSVGELVIATNGTANSFPEGIGRLANGATLVSTNPPVATDAFCGGMRINSAGALCILPSVVPSSTFDSAATVGTQFTLTNGNKTFTATGASFSTASTTTSKSSGKFYFEVLINTGAAGNDVTIGVTSGTTLASRTPTQVGDGVAGWGYVSDRGRYYHAATTNDGHASTTTNDVVMVAVDISGGKIWFGKNGVWNDSGNPATGVNAAYSDLTGTIYPACSVFSTGSVTYHPDAANQTYAAPSGFVAWG